MLANSGHIHNLWNSGGPFIGSNGKPHVRITVQVGWTLGEYNSAVGSFKKPPLRYAQVASQNQVETEIPNVLTMTVTESIDQDAATLTFDILNQKLDALNVAPFDAERFGNPGYYTFSRGDTAASATLWGQTPNEWNDVLVPNALLRTYEGFGGTDKTIAQALADGNLVQTGVWLVDDVTVATGGKLAVSCRNLGKLIIDQPLYPPLVPMWDVNGCDVYPLRYARYFHIHGTQTETILYGAGGPVGDTGHKIFGIEYAPDISPCRPDQEGYWLPGDDGGVFSYGYIDFYGSLAGIPLNKPIVGLTGSADNNGYWLAAADGGVFAFGDAQFYGSLPSIGVNVSNIVAIERSRAGNGYLLAGSNGGVYAFGDAVFNGSGVGTVSGNVVGMDVRRTGGTGYWLCTNTGFVYAFGAASHYGGLNGAFDDVVAFASTATDAGYYIVRANGKVYAYGDAVHRGDASNLTLNDPMTDIAVHPSGNGYWLAAEDGGVFTYGPGIQYWGSLPGPFVNLGIIDGNYDDYTKIVKDLLLWSGFWLNDGGVSPEPHGNLEMTGIYNNTADGGLPEEMFDKKAAIDVINELKLVVGFIFWIDNEGAAHFESPNWWSPGNFLPNGAHTTVIPTIHEDTNLPQYQLTYSGSAMRSRIVIASAQPDLNIPGTVMTDYTSQNVAALRGLHIPFPWSNKLFITPGEQQVMAELVDLHINMQRRLGSTNCPANPLIQINDQVQIIERETSEAYIHYVRSITRTWDRKSGRYTMSLNTNWLGDEDEWTIVIPDVQFVRTINDDLQILDSRTQTSTASGTAHTRSRTDVLGITDTWTLTLSGVGGSTRAAADTGSLRDAGQVRDTEEIRTDAMGLDDSVTGVRSGPANPVGITDSVTTSVFAAGGSTQTKTDALGITDSRTATISGSSTTAKSVTDSLGLPDDVTGQLTGDRERLGITDSVSKNL